MTNRVANIFDEWQISPEELTDLIQRQPSLRSMLIGHVGRFQLKRLLSRHVTSIEEQDNHNRERRGSITVRYRNKRISIRSCTVQSNSIRKRDNITKASFQCDGSDRRPVKVGSETVETTCVLSTDFDVVGVSLYPICKRWEFAFAATKDMNKTKSKTIPVAQRGLFLATQHPISYPVEAPYTTDFIKLFERVSNAL